MNIQGAKYLWSIPTSDEQQIAQVAAEHNLSFPLAQTLLSRGLASSAAIYEYLFCPSKIVVAHASVMKDAQKAVERILKAIKNNEKILVCGDYDVDGITSSAMMMLCLLPLKAQINFFLPHRVKDGYGLSTKSIERAARSGYTVIITVDNGISAHEPAVLAQKLGIDLIITDHHKPHAQVPLAYAIVNPNQLDCAYPAKTLAGVGVTFKLLALLYEQLGLPLPEKVYELLLLGTVADVVPLVGENRFWVRHGLLQVNKIESLSLRMLKENARFQAPRLSSLDVGFLLAPQINALGRLEDAREGVKFLIGDSRVDIERVGHILADLNKTRKELERGVVSDIMARIDRKEIDLATENIIVAAGDNWPPGVIGLAASRLVSSYGRPAIVLHKTRSGIAKGSCRSISAFNIFAALQSCSHLLEQFGGHPQAAGLSIKNENIPLLKQALEKLIAQELTPADLQPKLMIDAQARLSDFNKSFIKQLELLEPFGAGNANPIFCIKQATFIQKPVLLKEQHVKCQLFDDGVIKPIIFFNRPDIYEKLLAHEQQPFCVATQVKENHWEGRTSIELTGLDIAV